MRVGEVDLFLICDGCGRLDGAGMFGMVPRVMWEKEHPPDDQNRLLMQVNCLFIKDGKRSLLVDTGAGGKAWGLTGGIVESQLTGQLPSQLQQHSVDPAQVDVVISTHLHFDHTGGNTVRRGRSWVPAFPNATYVIQQGEWEGAVNPNELTRNSHLLETLFPLQEHRRLELIKGNAQITSHVRVLLTPGHTPNHQSVVVESNGEMALFIGDLAPMATHLEHRTWVPALDLAPARTIETRRRVQEWLIEKRILVLFSHDPHIGTGYLRSGTDRFWVEPVDTVETTES